MYLICFTGTLAVFYLEIERLEQPVAEEYAAISPKVVEQSFNHWLQNHPEITEHMYIVFPSASLPRVKFASEKEGVYVDQNGVVGNKAYDDYSHLITGLHINLHLPQTIGIIIVSALGAMLCGLVVSGFLAHPRIFKDAFQLRLNGSKTVKRSGHSQPVERLGSALFLDDWNKPVLTLAWYCLSRVSMRRHSIMGIRQAWFLRCLVKSQI